MIKKKILVLLTVLIFFGCNDKLSTRDKLWIKEELKSIEKSINFANLEFENLINDFSKGMKNNTDFEAVVKYIKGIDKIPEMYINKISENENVIFCAVGVKVDKDNSRKKVYQKIDNIGFIILESVSIEDVTHIKSNLKKNIDKLEYCRLDTREFKHLASEVIRFEYSKKFDSRNDVNLSMKIAVIKK